MLGSTPETGIMTRLTTADVTLTLLKAGDALYLTRAPDSRSMNWRTPLAPPHSAPLFSLKLK
jgi:hypothetical protein